MRYVKKDWFTCVHNGTFARYFCKDPNGKTSGITGALAKGEIYKPSVSGTLIYLSTEDIEKALENVKSQGGEILFPKTDAGEYGFVAEFKDLEGNRIALFESKWH